MLVFTQFREVTGPLATFLGQIFGHTGMVLHGETAVENRKTLVRRFLVDGCIPSDMATSNSAQIEEERRLLYVAMTRAKQYLHLVQPQRFFRTHQHGFGSGYTIAPRSRFLPNDILPLFTRRAAATPEAVADTLAPQPVVGVDIAARLRGMWG